MTQPATPDPAEIARKLPKDARLCILNWGDKKTPVPDSVWFGKFAALKRHAPDSATTFILSPLGLAVRAHLEAKS
jgi:hypothetical protein